MQEEARSEETGFETSIAEDEDVEGAGGNGRENIRVFETDIAGVLEVVAVVVVLEVVAVVLVVEADFEESIIVFLAICEYLK